MVDKIKTFTDKHAEKSMAVLMLSVLVWSLQNESEERKQYLNSLKEITQSVNVNTKETQLSHEQLNSQLLILNERLNKNNHE